MPVILGPAPVALPFTNLPIAAALTDLRQDIFDQAGPSPRWQDSDLARAIDRAIDRYSFMQPLVQSVIVAGIAGQRLYPVPSNPLGNAWWIEQVEYPTDQWPRQYQPYQEMPQPQLGPPSAPTAAVGPAGVLTGLYQYRVTYLGIAGESAASPSSGPITLAAQQSAITLPLGPDPYVTGRKLYRTAAGGADGTQLLVATIADNSSSTYTDNAADGTLGAPMPAGDTTMNVPLLELRVSDARLPSPSVQQNMQITFSAKHLWAANGTTIPEQHHDVVLLGAAAYACLAIQVPTNDLFQYQDGELRDQVNEISTPIHWLAAGQNLMAMFESRIKEIKEQRNAAFAELTQWGSVPSRWQWT